MRDHAQPLGVGQLGELFETALAVHHDALEPAEESSPEIPLLRGSAGQEIVRGEDERLAKAQDAVVELGGREPLQVRDVRAPASQSQKPDRVLEELHRDSQP